MNRLSMKYFGDIVRHDVEDEYLNIAIIPVKPRRRDHCIDDKLLPEEDLNRVCDEIQREAAGWL